MMEWQPIETAPNDGTHFLAVCGNCETRNHWIVRRDGESFICYDDAEEMGGGLFVPCLAFWMPLPPPPNAQ